MPQTLEENAVLSSPSAGTETVVDSEEIVTELAAASKKRKRSRSPPPPCPSSMETNVSETSCLQTRPIPALKRIRTQTSAGVTEESYSHPQSPSSLNPDSSHSHSVPDGCVPSLQDSDEFEMQDDVGRSPSEPENIIPSEMDMNENREHTLSG